MESPEATLVPGYRLDRYELLCPIASGGMASVWLARLRGKRGFEKLFAIKTIKTDLIADPHFQEMFLDEARIAARIVHPNVAQILELGEQDDVLFLVMEYVDGDSLAKISRLAWKRGAQLPPGVSMRIIAETCAGLHAAHQLTDSKGESLGVVHRDVSPQNILITGTGTAKVIDFGLVKAKNRGAAETGQGVVKGKIRYMAPEQVGGSKTIDRRADVWACGMCLYELITGHTPFHEEDDLEVVKRLMSDAPLPSFDVAMPRAIEGVLRRAIASSPDDRFESCSAMRRAIEGVIHELDLRAENEDVAEVIRATLPDLGERRSKTIAKAMEAADLRLSQGHDSGAFGSREAAAGSLDDVGSVPELAFAATEVSARDGDAVLPLTRKSKAVGADASASQPQTVSQPGRLSAQLEEQKRGGAGYIVAALAVAGAAAAILWPRGATETSEPAVPSVSAAPTIASSLDIPPATSSQETIEVDPPGSASATSTASPTPPSTNAVNSAEPPSNVHDAGPTAAAEDAALPASAVDAAAPHASDTPATDASTPPTSVDAGNILQTSSSSGS